MRIKTLLGFFEKMPERAKELIFEYNDINIIKDISFYTYYCESPIELILTTSIEIYKAINKDNLYYEPQTEVIINNKKYIVDFMIFSDKYVNTDLPENFKLIIECDGFEFHHSNKKQVEYDNKREYDFKTAGYQILRFTGTEIYKEPLECAKKIFDYLEKFRGKENDR